MAVQLRPVEREKVKFLAPWLVPDFDLYREKSPHETAKPEDLLQFLSEPEGDRLLIVGVDRVYAGFITLRVQELDGERWCTVGMILLRPEAQRREVLEQVGAQLEAFARREGCDLINYMTKRKGFAKWALGLGYRPRIVEYVKEL